jgi:hypothetical protein
MHATAESQSALAGSKLPEKNYHFPTRDVKHFQKKGKGSFLSRVVKSVS